MFRTYLLTCSITLFAVCSTGSLFAQVDINTMIQEQMGQHGVTVTDDNDPFVPNAFLGSFRMEMHTYTGEEELKSSPMDMHYWSTAEMTLVQTTGPTITQEMKILTDLKGKWQYLLLTDAKGNKTAVKSPKKKVAVDEKIARNAPDIRMTDETKAIDGHVCTKMISKSDDGTWTGWMAKDIEMPFADMMRQVQQPSSSDHSSVITGVYGFPLEYQWVDANGKDRMVCYIRDMKQGAVDEKVFSLEGYAVMELPSFGK